MAQSRLGVTATIDPTAHVVRSKLGRYTEVGARTKITETVLDDYSYIVNDGDVIYAGDDDAFFDWRRSHAVTIGHDVWIGHGVVILPGLTIGTGAVVAAGAVVSKDVAPYTIVAGVAAKPVKHRFSDTIADSLQELAWWDWSHEQLRVALPDFRSLGVEAFIEKYR